MDEKSLDNFFFFLLIQLGKKLIRNSLMSKANFARWYKMQNIIFSVVVDLARESSIHIKLLSTVIQLSSFSATAGLTASWRSAPYHKALFNQCATPQIFSGVRSSHSSSNKKTRYNPSLQQTFPLSLFCSFLLL